MYTKHLSPAVMAFTPTIGVYHCFLMLIAILAAGWLSPSYVQAATLDGLWTSDGFRRVLVVEKDKVQSYELTALSCLLSWEATGKVADGGAISFLVNGCERRLELDPASDIAKLSSDCCVTDFFWRRLSTKPKGFGEQADNTPQASYAVFWQTFAENYPFFALHQVDWDSIDRTYRPQVTAQTTPKELFDIFWNMTAKLNDAHIYIRAIAPTELQAESWGRRPDGQRIRQAERNRLMGIIKGKFVPGIKAYCQSRIYYGMTKDEIGYLCINAFGAYAPGDAFGDHKKAMDEALDTIFQDSLKWKGLIIDVRQNSGGWAGMDVWLATRLTAEKYLAYTTETRDNLEGPLHFTPRQQVWVNPSSRPAYLGKVALLIGRDTVSSGENFALALMGRKPVVTRIGENTQGVFSEILERRLPNGWKFGLPNQIYRTADGRSFDGVGVPPDVAVPVFSKEDLKEGRDSGMAKAVEVLLTTNVITAHEHN